MCLGMLNNRALCRPRLDRRATSIEEADEEMQRSRKLAHRDGTVKNYRALRSRVVEQGIRIR